MRFDCFRGSNSPRERARELGRPLAEVWTDVL